MGEYMDYFGPPGLKPKGHAVTWGELRSYMEEYKIPDDCIVTVAPDTDDLRESLCDHVGIGHVTYSDEGREGCRLIIHEKWAPPTDADGNVLDERQLSFLFGVTDGT
jgi:hypothetical protein